MRIKLKKFVLEDEKGGKVTVSFDNISTEDIVKIIKKLQNETPITEEKLQSMPKGNLDSTIDYESLTIRKKLKLVVNQIKHGWFTSDHVRELYQYHFREEIRPSTVSTYLARMYDDNFLERRGSRAKREYCLAEKETFPVERVKEI
ncbi:MAG: hypothetical protein ACFFD2_10445 [Promethearchaeota archaeon]